MVTNPSQYKNNHSHSLSDNVESAVNLTFFVRKPHKEPRFKPRPSELGGTGGGNPTNRQKHLHTQHAIT